MIAEGVLEGKMVSDKTITSKLLTPPPKLIGDLTCELNQACLRLSEIQQQLILTNFLPLNVHNTTELASILCLAALNISFFFQPVFSETTLSFTLSEDGGCFIK